MAKKMAWDSSVPGRESLFQLKRLALIREAGKTFAKNGFHNTSLDDVANVLGVTKPALYHYVRTKEEILFECNNIALDLGEQARAQAAQESASPSERLRRTLTLYITAVTGEIGTYAVLAEPISSLTEPYRGLIIERRRQASRAMEKLVEGAIAEGAIGECDPKLAVAFFMAAINGLNRWFTPGGKQSGTEVAAAFINFTFFGLRANQEMGPTMLRPVQAFGD